MAKVGSTVSKPNSPKMRPAINPEARDNQLISLATDLAEQQIRDGTASSQVITHYLKLGASKERDRLELERLEEENKLLRAKTEQLKSMKRSEELMQEAINAFRSYAGQGDPNEY